MKFLLFLITFLVVLTSASPLGVLKSEARGAGHLWKMMVQQEEPGFFDGIVTQFNDYLTQAEDWFNWLVTYVQGALGM